MNEEYQNEYLLLVILIRIYLINLHRINAKTSRIISYTLVMQLFIESLHVLPWQKKYQVPAKKNIICKNISKIISYFLKI